MKLSMRRHADNMFHELSSDNMFSGRKIAGFYEKGISPLAYVNFVNERLPIEIREILGGEEAIRGLHVLASSICRSIFICFRFASRDDRFLLESCFSNSMRMISDAIAGISRSDGSSGHFRLMDVPNSFCSENAISMFSYRTFYELFAENGILPSPSFAYLVLESRKNFATSQTRYDREASDAIRKFFAEHFPSIVALIEADDVQKVHLLKEDEDFIEQFREEFGINQCEDEVVEISDDMINSLYRDTIFANISLDARARGFLLGLPAFAQHELLIEDKRAIKFLPYLDEIYQDAEPIFAEEDEEPSIWQRCREEFLNAIYFFASDAKNISPEMARKFHLIGSNAPTLVADLSRTYLSLVESGDSREGILDIVICFAYMDAFTGDEIIRIIARHPTIASNLDIILNNFDIDRSIINRMNASILQQCLANGCIEKHYMDFSRHKAEAKNLGLSEDELRELCNSIPIYVVDLPKYSEFVGNSFIEGINLRRNHGFFHPEGIHEDNSKGPTIYINNNFESETSDNFDLILQSIGSEDAFSFPELAKHHEVAHSIANARGFKNDPGDNLDDDPGNLSYLLSPQEAIAIVHGEIPYIVSLLKDCLLSAMSSDAVQAALRRWYVSEMLRSEDAQMLGFMTNEQISDYAHELSIKFAQDESEIFAKKIERQSEQILDLIFSLQEDRKYETILSLRGELEKMREHLSSIPEESETLEERKRLEFGIEELTGRIRNLIVGGKLDASVADILSSIVLGYLKQRLPIIFFGELTEEIHNELIEHAEYLTRSYSNFDPSDRIVGSELANEALGMNV